MRIMDVLRKCIRSFPKRLRDHALEHASRFDQSQRRPNLYLQAQPLSVRSLVPHSLNMAFLTPLTTIQLMAQHPLTTAVFILSSKDNA